MFIYRCRFALSFVVVAEMFGHSLSTVGDSFHTVLTALKPLHAEEVKDESERPDNRLLSDKFKRFQGCCGAIDGTHIPAMVPFQSQIPWRNRKG
jgi:hypothetical protein